MRWILLVLATTVVMGCGSSTTVTVGEPGQKGILRTSIDTSRDVAKDATEKVKQNESDLNGV